MVKLIKIYFIPLISIILLIIGFVEVNIINTESLSPLGTTEDNFKVVSDEFGEDFQEFIMDKSPIKIYVGEKNDGMATVKFYNKYINLTNNNGESISVSTPQPEYITETFNFKPTSNSNNNTENGNDD